MFLLLLLVAVQILFNLYANTMVTSAAHTAARSVAGHSASDDRCAAVEGANERFVETLGEYGDGGHATLEWTCRHPDAVAVRISATHPTILPARMSGLLGLGHLERTIVVRVEAFVE